MLYKTKDFGFTKLSKGHLENLFYLKNESWFGTHKISIVNMDDQKKWYESISKDVHQPPHLFLIGFHIDEMEVKRGPVGIFKYTSIDWVNRKADVGWDIFEKNRGKGLGKKIVKCGVSFAKDVLNLRRLNAEILINNTPSQKCAIEAGFIQEGCKRKEIHKKGEYLDNLIYGVLLNGNN